MLKDYPQNLWKDNETLSTTLFDGFAYEDYPYQNDAASQDRNTPFVVKMGDKLKLTSLELVDTGANTYNGDTDYITGAGYDYTFNSSHFDVTQYSGYKILSCRNYMESTQAVSNTVDIKNLSLPWKVTTSGGANIASGSCDIKVYVPFDDPKISNSPCLKVGGCSDDHLEGFIESLLNISCKAAKGAATKAETFSLMWKKIQTCHLELLDGRVLTYWGDGNDTPAIHWTTDEFLTSRHGRCHHWMLFFVDLLRSQGIDANYNDNEPFSIFPNPNRQYEYIRGHGVVFSDSGIVRSVKLEQKASHFQGGGDPNSIGFQNHIINIYDGNYYDATCGAGPYEASQSGFLQYLRENVRITSGDLVCQGDNLVIEDFYSSYYPINE